MKKFVYDMQYQITPPTLILSTKYHKHLGTINNVGENIANDFNMASHQEISFDVYKTLDGELCNLWDDIVDFKYVYVPEHEEYYELQVTIDDADNTIKHCVGISAGECELSQRYVRDFHCNDETDILYSPKYQVVDGIVSEVDKKNGIVDFEYDDSDSDLVSGQTEQYKATVLYRPIYATDNKWLKMKKQRSSLLYRILKDKCPDWSISYVDDTLVNLQRTFNIDGATVYDALTNTIATEIGCLFKFNSVNRTIAVYDLKNTCTDQCKSCKHIGAMGDNCPKCGSTNIDRGCGFRGEFVDKCPRCGKTHFIRGYGDWKKVFVSTDNTALQISVDGDADSVKNCFKIVGGDDLITATVANINPNKSNYIYRFSDDMKASMPPELVDKLDEYQKKYQENVNTYTNLTDEWYQMTDEVANLQTKMMPETPMPEETSALEQLNLLMAQTIIVSVQDLSSAKSTVDLSVENYVKVLLDPRYTVQVSDSTLSGISSGTRTWRGKFTVKSLGGVDEDGNPDEATSATKKDVTINDDYEAFLNQKILKTLDRSDAAMMNLFNIEDETDFAWALHSYSLDRLNSFSSTYQSILEVLINMNAGEKDYKVYGVNVYREVYLPNYTRKGLVDSEAKVREGEIKDFQNIVDRLDSQRKQIQTMLDLPTFLGDELYKTFVLFLREDTYTNSNYISDGMDNAGVIDISRELFYTAESELVKASELQFTLTGQLANFLNTEEFKDFKDEFEIGDYIVCKADEKLYRLRIVNVNYSYDSPEDIQITFSNIVRGGNFMSDVSSVLSKASSMATSYNYVAHQANQGNSANSVVKDFQTNGLNSSVYNIIAGKNQDVVIDSHGITAREFDDTINDYSPEQLKITNHSIAFTDNNWKTASLSLGRQEFRYFDDKYTHRFVTGTRYGLAADFVNAGYITGSQIISGQIYSTNYNETTKAGAYIDLDNGYFTFAGGKLKFDANGLTIAGDIEDGSVINNAIINNSAINNDDKFIVTDGGNVVLNGTVSGTAWATKQDKLTAGTNITISNDNVISATGGADYTELTQAQYDALSYAEKHNGKIYFITDGEGGGGGSTVIVNPTGTPTAVMTKISVDGVIYSLPTGVTDVRVNNTSVVTSGIANIDLSTYATTTALTNGLATKQNTLTAGSNITITNNTISATDTTYTAGTNVSIDSNNVISATGGSDVEANPSGTATESLTSIGIDGDIYSITGSGGTTVVANPSGTPTDDLETIQIGNIIYEVVGGGSGGGTSFKETTLWKNTNGAGVGTYMLDESIDNYDFITVRYGKWVDYAGATPLCDYRILSVKDLQAMHDEGIYVVFTGYESRVAYCDFNDDVMQVTFINGNQLILQVDGIKIGSGSGSGSGGSITPVSELIEFGAGDGSNSRTFTINSDRIPKNLILTYFEDTGDTGWATQYELIWGASRAFGVGSGSSPATSGEIKAASITYDTDGKTFTLAGSNAGSALNSTTGHGYILVNYGEGGSGGSGEGYSETSLWSGSDSATMQLSESFENYDAIMIIATASTQQGNYRLTNIWSVDYLKNHINDGIRFGLTGDAWYIYFSITNNTTFTRQDHYITYISEIKGLKFGGGGSSEPDISDMTWTQLISQVGGVWSSATAIPSGTKYLGIAIDHENAVYMPKTLKLSELDKYASMLNYTIVREGIHWKHDTSNDDIYYDYDSANQTIKVYAGWSGLSVKVFAIS